jgi:hypothetical protein
MLLLLQMRTKMLLLLQLRTLMLLLRRLQNLMLLLRRRQQRHRHVCLRLWVQLVLLPRPCPARDLHATAHHRRCRCGSHACQTPVLSLLSLMLQQQLLQKGV